MSGTCRLRLLVVSNGRMCLITRHLAQVAHLSGNSDDVTSSAKPFSSIPQPPRLPFFGHTYLYRGLGPFRIEKYHEALRSLYARYGPVVRQQLQGGAQGTALHVFELEDVRAVLQVAASTPLVPPIQEGSRLYRLSKGLAVGLGNMNGEVWQGLRRAVQTVLLQPREVTAHLPATDIAVHQLVESVRQSRSKEGSVHSLYSILARWFLDMAGQIMFDKPLGALNGDQKEKDEAQAWIQSNIDIFRYNAKLKVSSPLFKIFPIKPWRKLVRAEDTFHLIIGKHLLTALQELQSLVSAGQLGEKFHFLAGMTSRKAITHKDLVFFVHSLVSDGLATVPSTMQSAIQCLANNPDVQEKAYQEIVRVVDPSQPLTSEIIDKLPYLKAIVKETFRMYPLGTEVSRILPKDMVLGGYHVPAGTVIDLNHSSLLKTERYFPEPLIFKPERWLRGNQATNNAILLTPFGHGPRMCVGRRISQQAIHAGLARLLQTFKFENPEDDPPYGQVYQTLLFPDRELKTRFFLRSQ